MKIKVGLLGMGNVGTGTYKTLDMNREKIFDSTGLDIEITKVLVNDTSKDRGIKLPSEKLTQNPDDIFLDKNIDIVVELIGGIEPATGRRAHGRGQDQHGQLPGGVRPGPGHGLGRRGRRHRHEAWYCINSHIFTSMYRAPTSLYIG